MSTIRIIGRVLFSIIFIIGGVSKIGENFNQVLAIATKKMSETSPFQLPDELYLIFFVISIILETAGGILIAIGQENIGSKLLLLFLVIITPVVHNFWTMEGQEQKVEIVTFFKNCALIGALLVFISDQRLRRATLRQAQKQNQVPPKQVLSKQTPQSQGKKIR